MIAESRGFIIAGCMSALTVCLLFVLNIVYVDFNKNEIKHVNT